MILIFSYCTEKKIRMERRMGWSDVELGSLARSWLYASEDAILGNDKTTTRFNDTMFDNFKTFALSRWADKAYGGRNPDSVRSKYDEISADILTFREALRVIRAANPTGVTYNEVLSIAITIHHEKSDRMSYEARGCAHDSW